MMSLPPQQCYKAGALTKKKNSSWTNCNEKLSNLQQLAFLATFPDTKAKVTKPECQETQTKYGTSLLKWNG